MNLSTLDLSVVAIYAVVLLVLAQWVSREKAGHEKDSSDYFLAGRALPWWAIGASLIAANISAEQIIGMSGSAFVMGIAIGVYEWTAAITLIVVAKWLLPVFLKHKIYTMPQFLEQRYDHRVRTVMALFWLGIYVFVNLTSILWLGALAVNTVTGVDLSTGLIALGAFAAAPDLETVADVPRIHDSVVRVAAERTVHSPASSVDMASTSLRLTPRSGRHRSPTTVIGRKQMA